MFEFTENRRNIPDEELLKDLQHVSKKLGTQTLTRSQYEEYGSFGFTTMVRRFGKWSVALNKAGLNIKVPINNSNEDLFSNLADVWVKLGRQPSYGDLNKSNSKFSVGTYENRFGSWNKALKAFIDFTNSNDIALEIPEKIKNSGKRTPRSINWRLRAKILIRDACICQMCGTSPAKNPNIIMHVDHIKPWSKGGETVVENLRALCHICNVGKSDIEIDS